MTLAVVLFRGAKIHGRNSGLGRKTSPLGDKNTEQDQGSTEYLGCRKSLAEKEPGDHRGKQRFGEANR